jgi:arginase
MAGPFDSTPYYGLLGVPSSLGAKTPGIEKAQAALREAGLIEQLQQAGCIVVDHGDLPVQRHIPDPHNRTAQNVTQVAAVAREVARRVESILATGQTPLLLGGDCSISLGFVAAFVGRYPDASLLYIDGGVDLETPATNPEGNLDSMGVAHMLGHAGTVEALSHIGPRFPLLTPAQLLYYGYEPMPPDDAEEQVLHHYNIPGYTAAEVRDYEMAAAVNALVDLESGHGPYFIHFDVDVIDFVDFPIADVPAINQGLTFAQTMESLSLFSKSTRFGGIAITEINPDHMADGGMTQFVAALVRALAP